MTIFDILAPKKNLIDFANVLEDILANEAFLVFFHLELARKFVVGQNKNIVAVMPALFIKPMTRLKFFYLIVPIN